MLQGYKLIFISSELNLKFYELEAKANRNLTSNFLANIIGL